MCVCMCVYVCMCVCVCVCVCVSEKILCDDLAKGRHGYNGYSTCILLLHSQLLKLQVLYYLYFNLQEFGSKTVLPILVCCSLI